MWFADVITRIKVKINGIVNRVCRKFKLIRNDFNPVFAMVTNVNTATRTNHYATRCRKLDFQSIWTKSNARRHHVIFKDLKVNCSQIQ